MLTPPGVWTRRDDQNFFLDWAPPTTYKSSSSSRDQTLLISWSKLHLFIWHTLLSKTFVLNSYLYNTLIIIISLSLLGIMYTIWLYSLIQCIIAVLVMGVSMRLCLAAGSAAAGAGTRNWSTSACLKLCLGLVGSVGSIVVASVSVVLNLRSSQCLYTCIAMVSCPLLVRQFTMCLLLLLTLNTHLQCRLGNRWVWTSRPCIPVFMRKKFSKLSAIFILA